MNATKQHTSRERTLQIQRMILVCLFLLMPFSTQAQEYIWPTSAEKYISSSFAEYRPGHFHAGIDIKTWGREGYKVFAIHDGYIWRMRVSPYGYGKVLYQKLNSGEIVIYGHLQKFNAKLQDAVKREQRRTGEYRLNKYFSPQRYPVKKGEVIAYTGSTGAGPAHLHFEVRDAKNHPMNPFLLGYRVKDTIPPGISGLCITPLDATSTVDSDVRQKIIIPKQLRRGQYEIKDRPLLNGQVGFAIDCWDKANGASNVFAVYRFNFYVNGELKYSAVYNKFSYDVTGQIDLDRDYRLNKQGKGLFQKLYKDIGNELPFYKPIETGSGIISCDISDQMIADNGSLHQRGPYDYLIELYDVEGNLTTLRGEFFVGDFQKLNATFASNAENGFVLTNVLDDAGRSVRNYNIYRSVNNGQTWKRFNPRYQGGADLENPMPVFQITQPIEVIKIVAKDSLNKSTIPVFRVLTRNVETPLAPIDFEINKEFYDDYLRIELNIHGLIKAPPRMFVQQIGIRPIEVDLVQYEFNRFIGIYKLQPHKDGTVDIEAYAQDLSGKELTFWDQFDIVTISPKHGGRLISKDRKCDVQFDGNVVYKNMFARLEKVPANGDTATYDVVGGIYDIEPFDVPMKKSATVYLSYPENEPMPEKLGVYTKAKSKKNSKWGFSGNVLDHDQRRISARMGSLRQVTLIRDIDPPEIRFYYPKNRAHITRRYPTLRATVRDMLSGFNDERSITMKLDDRKVIAEYDPERHLIKYRVEESLDLGYHTVSVSAVDNCGNEQTVTHSFTVVLPKK